MVEINASDAGRALAARRRRHERACAVCGGAFTTSGRGVYCGQTCKKRAHRARKYEESLLGTDQDPLIVRLNAVREQVMQGRTMTVDSAEVIRQARDERDEELWRAITS